ncbi:MAG: aldehyde dehydrogenase family protein [Verrucomicrobiales bacterium]|nr:aldehyde dehydrogenase family protein [Verrucomicrobiales bacterium]
MAGDKHKAHLTIPELHDSQRNFFASGTTKSVAYRLEKFGKLEKTIRDSEREILKCLQTDLGKPEVESYVSEVYFLLHEIRRTRKMLRRWVKPEKARNPFYFLPAKSEIRREPFGTVLAMAPWNYPFQLSLSPLIGAIASGNTVILKPSEKAPATSTILKQIVSEVFEPAHATVVTGGPDVASALLEIPFDLFFFTGGEKVGRVVAAAAAKHLSPVVLELGGKSPCIVDRTADIDISAERIVSGKFLNAGQTCMAPDFVAAEESIRKPLSDKIRQLLEERYGNNREEDIARMIDPGRFDEIMKVVVGPVYETGGNNRKSLKISPKLLPRAKWTDASMNQEIFGPVLPVVSFHDIDDLLKQLRALPPPLALYIFSRNSKFRESIAQSMPSGSICYNDVIKQATNFDLPFGGVGASGMGRYRGKAGFETFTYSRSVTKRYFWKDPFTLEPPYENALERLRKILK